jgi:non-lysosomal glucosylceramidase
MKKQTGVNRRQFLTSTSAAIGVAAIAGASLSAEDEGSTKAASSAISNPQGARAARGPLRSYTGAAAGEVAFPLGGIGTGTVSLGGRGELRDWEIFNRPAKRRTLPFTSVTLWTKAEGERPLLRLVEGPPQPPFAGWNGYNHESGQGLPHFQQATLSGKYPIATVDFEDRALPVTVSLEAFTPFIPLNVDASSLPVAIFEYRIANQSKKAADVSLAFSLLNPVGYDGKAFLDSNEHPGFGKNLNRLRQEQVAGAKVAGLDLTSEKYPTGDPLNGSMALLTTHPSFTILTSCIDNEWFDCRQSWVNEFLASGRFNDSGHSKLTPDGVSAYATLAPYARLAAGEAITITFVLAWHFPVRDNYWHYKDEQVRGRKLTNYYGTRFKNAWDVATYTASRLPELKGKTRLFKDTFFSSTTPPEVLEAVSSQVSILRTNTCILLEGKQFFGFEGCADDEALGWMNCAHVWNYEHAVAFLFPELERSMRDTDFLHEVRDDDSMAFRAMVPLGIKQWDFRPAADGQMGCILKLYREWQISGDDAFLKKMWPNAKRALEFAWKFWDADKDGVMEGEQHNTYDIEFFGPNPMITTLYLGALKAAELMAAAVGDSSAAESYRAIREKGARNFESMWNGEFYIQKTTPVDQIRPMPPYDKEGWKERVVHEGQLKYQFGEGCLSDQMLGQWFADVLGLDIGLQPERVRKALQSVYRHNFKQDFWDHPNTQRIYAIDDEQGLLVCSWPNGGRPALPLVYGDEVWTGIEYQVAAHLIYRGLIEEGLSIVRAISNRYDGVRRNPWNQIEWGNHYSRAMASFSVLLALSGFRYSAVERRVTFQPCIHPEDFRCFFAASSAWGLYSQKAKEGVLTAELECRHGELILRRLVLGGGLTKTTFAKSTLTGPDGKQIRCSVKPLARGHEIELAEELTVREGESATATLTR